MTPRRRIQVPSRPRPAPGAAVRKPAPARGAQPAVPVPDIASTAASPEAFLWLQRNVGNTALSRQPLSGAARSSPVQRHAPGFRPSIDPERAAAELRGGAGAEAAAPEAAGPPAPVPAATPAPAVGPEGGGGGAAAPAAPRPRALRNEAMALATAEAALSRSYGRIRRIVTVPVTILDHAGILRAYDDDCIARGVLFTDPRTGATRPWRRGDADPGIEGFALTDRSRIYVQSDTTLPTATAHELLHANTAADFRGAVGEAINEGTTEHLAIKALTAAGLPTMGPTGAQAYSGQVTAVQQLISVLGEDTLISAYFGGAASLVSAYEALMPHTFAALRGSGTLDTAHMAALLVPRTTAQKIALVRERLALERPDAADMAAIRAICSSDAAQIPEIRSAVAPRIVSLANSLLDGWVSDADLDCIDRLDRLPITDRGALAAALEPRAISLTSLGQRMRLRVILARR